MGEVEREQLKLDKWITGSVLTWETRRRSCLGNEDSKSDFEQTNLKMFVNRGLGIQRENEAKDIDLKVTSTW